MKNPLSRPFLLVLIIAVLAACFLVFRPFMIEIVMAAVLTSILYKPYGKLKKFFGGRAVPASLIMCLLTLILVILPLSELIIYAAKQSITAYGDTVNFISQNSPLIHSKFLDRLGFLGFDTTSIRSFVTDIVGNFSDFFINIATTILKEASSFFFSLFTIVFAMFFFFLDGDKMAASLSRWSPMSNDYDKLIFAKFREISYASIITNFVVILAQGFIGAVGYAVAGLPFFIPGLLIAICSLLPIFGAAIVYVPTGIYLLAIGSIWQGIFVLLWGFLVISTIDNLLRMTLLQDKAQINPIFVLFSIMGGTLLFGFWGVILGPMIVALAVTMMDIYVLEFRQDLSEAIEKQKK
ncbi:MAG: AI-2E family transporter [Candidatus Falkowbacteria bacterium]